MIEFTWTTQDLSSHVYLVSLSRSVNEGIRISIYLTYSGRYLFVVVLYTKIIMSTEAESNLRAIKATVEWLLLRIRSPVAFDCGLKELTYRG